MDSLKIKQLPKERQGCSTLISSNIAKNNNKNPSKKLTQYRLKLLESVVEEYSISTEGTPNRGSTD